MRSIKDEPELLNDNVKTLSIQKREEDAKWNKRKRSNISLDCKSKRLDAPGLDASPIITPRQLTMPESLANEDVFKTTDNSLAVSVQNQLQTLENQKTLQEHFGPLSRKYVGAILTGDRESDIDHVYSVYLDKIGMMFSNKRFYVNNADNIIIDGVQYVDTSGLYELIFKRIPDDVYMEDLYVISKSTRACY